MVSTNLVANGDVCEIPMIYNPKDRALEKQASRDADELALKSGLKSREQLSRENSPFASLLKHVNFSRVGLPS